MVTEGECKPLLPFPGSLPDIGAAERADPLDERREDLLAEVGLGPVEELVGRRRPGVGDSGLDGGREQRRVCTASECVGKRRGQTVEERRRGLELAVARLEQPEVRRRAERPTAGDAPGDERGVGRRAREELN